MVTPHWVPISGYPSFLFLNIEIFVVITIQNSLPKFPANPCSNLWISRTLRAATLFVAATSALTAFGATWELGNRTSRHRNRVQTTTTPTTTSTTPTTTTTPTATTTTTPTTTPQVTTTNNYYVATTGSDSNAGTQSSPFRTLTKAASVVKPSTTVHVAPGTYAETITATVSGTASGRIRYVSDTKWGAKLVPAAGANTMWKVDGGYTDIDGFQVDGTGSTSVRQGIYLTGGNSTVKNSWVHHVAENSGCDSDGGSGILADQYRGAAFNNYDFIGNLVHDIGGSCDKIQGIYHASSGTVKNNIVYASNYGIHLYHDDHDIDVVNNTVFGNRVFGIVYGGCSSAQNSGCPTTGVNIHNNIVYDNFGGIAGPIDAEDGNNTLRNNLVYGNRTDFDLSTPSLSQTSETVSANPQFVNYIRTGGGDYHIKSTSPVIDKGLSTIAPSTDINGKARPVGLGIDIGAYENY